MLTLGKSIFLTGGPCQPPITCQLFPFSFAICVAERIDGVWVAVCATPSKHWRSGGVEIQLAELTGTTNRLT
jgi:aspartate oxidase